MVYELVLLLKKLYELIMIIEVQCYGLGCVWTVLLAVGL